MLLDHLNYLKFIPFTNFDLWDTKRYTSKQIASKYSIVALGTCIKEENRKYKLFLEEEKEFGILGVNNKVGIFDAYLQKGKDINQPYKKMQVGWLAYNPYRINVGSIGVKKEEHKNEYISPAYVVFSCLDNLIPEYLFLLFKTDTFNRVINENTTGSVRQNLTIEILKKLEIPLPSLMEQQRIINTYYDKVNQANKLEQQANDLERKVEEYLYKSLGLQQIQQNYLGNLCLLKTIDYDKTDRWAIDYLSKYTKLTFLNEGKYKPAKLREVILEYQYGLSEKASIENIGLPMLRMNNILNSELVIDNLKYLKDSPELEKFILNKGDLLFNRTNSKELVGKTAIFDLDEKFTFASYLIRVKIDETKANISFINYLFNSSILQIQKDLVSRQITGQANINAQEMQDFLFPLPPLEIQNAISIELNKIKTESKRLISNSFILKQLADNEFEQTIFN